MTETLGFVQFMPPKLEFLQRQGWLDESHRELLEELAAVMWNGVTAKDMCQLVYSRALEAYSTPKGLILIDTMLHPSGRELFIYGMVGEDILKEAAKIITDLKKIAAYKSCNKIGGEGVPRGWLRAAPRLGFLPVSTHYVMELDDGR